MRVVKWELLPGQRSRAGHTATLVGRKIFVIGGRNGERFYNDVWAFDLDSEEWTQVQERAPFLPRAYHAATFLARKSQLWITGGSDSKTMHGDIHVLNTDTMEWFTPVLKSTFMPRGTHGAVVHPLNPNCILMFGGYGGPPGKSTWLGDVLVLDADSFVLEHLKPGGCIPSARGYHTFTTFGQHVLCYGGKNEGGIILDDIACVYNTIENKWFTPEMTGDSPGGRSNHAAVLMEEAYIVIHGGRSGQSRLNDIYSLEISDVTLLKWQKYGTAVIQSKSKLLNMIEKTEGPEGRAAHCIVADRKSVYMTGGYGGGGRTFSDIYVARRFPFKGRPSTTKPQKTDLVARVENEGWFSTKRQRATSSTVGTNPNRAAEDVGTFEPNQSTPVATTQNIVNHTEDQRSSLKRKKPMASQDDMIKELEELSKQNSTLVQELANAKTASSMALKSVQAECEQLRKQNVALKSDLASTRATNSELRNELETVQGENEQLRTLVTSLQEKVTTENRRSSLLQRQVDEFVAATQKTDIASTQLKEELQAAYFALEAKEKEKQELLRQLRTKEQELDERDGSLERLRALLEDATLERDEYKSCVQKLELELEKQIQTLQQTKTNYDAERNYLLQEIAERKGTADRIFTELGVSKESCRVMQEHVQQLTRQLEKANEKLEQRQREKDELYRTNGALTAENKQLTTGRDGAEVKLSLLSNELLSARTLIDRNELESKKLKEAADEAAQHICTLHSSLKKAQEELHMKVADNGRLRGHLHELEEFERSQLEQLKVHIEKLQCARQFCPGDMTGRGGR